MVTKTSPNTNFCGSWECFPLCESQYECCNMRSKQIKWDFVALVSHDAGSSTTVGEVRVVCVG